MLKAIVFDFDGVIVDSEPLHYQAFVMVGKSFGFEFNYRDYLLRFIGFDDRDAFRLMLKEAGFDGDFDARIKQLIEQKFQAFEALVKSGTAAIPGAIELVDDAHGRNLPIAVASGATRADIDLMLGILERRDRFGVIVSADMVARSKPDPQTYALAVQRLAEIHPALTLQPNECLAIEDTAAGLRSAKAAGLRTLGLTTTSAHEELLAAERVIDSLSGVTVEQLEAWYGDD